MAVVLAIYWALVRPLLLDVVSADLAELKSQMDWAVIDNRDGARSKAGLTFERELRDVNRSSGPSLIFVIFLNFSKRGNELRSEVTREEEIFSEAPEWMKSMRTRMDQLLMKRLVVNSPIWWIPVALILFVGVFSWKVKTWWNYIISISALNEDDIGLTC